MSFVNGLTEGIGYAYSLVFSGWDLHGFGKVVGFFVAVLPVTLPFWIPLIAGAIRKKRGAA